MMPSHYDHERLAQAHRRDLLHEAEHERMLAELPRADRSGLAIPARLIVFLRTLCIRLLQGFQRRIA